MPRPRTPKITRTTRTDIERLSRAEHAPYTDTYASERVSDREFARTYVTTRRSHTEVLG